MDPTPILILLTLGNNDSDEEIWYDEDGRVFVDPSSYWYMEVESI